MTSCTPSFLQLLNLVARKMMSVTAQSQFMALLMASHPRCGANSTMFLYSSSRNLVVCDTTITTSTVSPSPETTTTVLVGKGNRDYGMERGFVVSVARVVWSYVIEFGPVVKIIATARGSNFHVCVSPLLMSLIRPPEFPDYVNGVWLDPNRILVTKTKYSEECGLVHEVRIKSLTPKSKVCLLRQTRDSVQWCANKKWIVLHGKSSGDTSGSDVTILATPKPGQHHETTAVTVPIGGSLMNRGRPAGVRMWFGLFDLKVFFMALTWVHHERDAMWLVVDVEKTYSSQSLCVISSTTWEFTGDYLDKAFTLKLREGALCMIFLANFYFTNDAVYRVMEKSGNWEKLRTKIPAHYSLLVSQLNQSLFCISTTSASSFSEIWDCNNLADPIKVITFGDDGVTGIVGATACGFLIQLHGSYLRMIDASSGCCVLQMTQDSEYELRFYGVSSVAD